MFGGPNINGEEFQGDINIGDLIELHPEMMLVNPQGPVLVVESNNDKGIYDVEYTAFKYSVGVGRMDIKRVISGI